MKCLNFMETFFTSHNYVVSWRVKIVSMARHHTYGGGGATIRMRGAMETFFMVNDLGMKIVSLAP